MVVHGMNGRVHNAAENGHLEVLKWARLNGCPWNKNYCMNKAKNKEMIDWLELQP
jgi:hypothetical protein